MRRFLVGRVLQGAVVVFVVATLSFLLVRLAPGDPFTAILDDPRIDAETRAHWYAARGLDRPLGVQYVRFIAGAVRGDLGPSVAYGRPAADVLREALPHTLILMGTALAASIVLGIAFGAWQAAHHRRPAARVADGASLVVSSMPEFWLAVLLLLVFAYRLGILPSGGTVTLGMHDYLSPLGQLADRARHLALPAATLTLLATATIARYQRAALLEVLPNDFVRTARAKGLGERRVIYGHALRNALLPVITVVGLALPALVGGAVFVEYVFSWPGMGRVAVESFRARDYAVVVGATTLGAVLVVLGGIIAELLQALADPRLRGR